jgi:hypothetical protein
MFLSLMALQVFFLSCLHFPLSAIRTFTQLTNCVVFVPETKKRAGSRVQLPAQGYCTEATRRSRWIS